jgi:hypothetical protein
MHNGGMFCRRVWNVLSLELFALTASPSAFDVSADSDVD